jgi:hypothetical protein
MCERTLDEMFNEFARAFIGEIISDRDVAFPNRLPRQKLDFSLASLHQVDRYLTYVHKKHRKLSDADWSKTVLWGGAYVGEVIRGLAPADYYHWIDYHEYMPQHPELQSLIPERTAATCAFLVTRTGKMLMPLNKVARYIEEGYGNSVYFLASCYLSDVDEKIRR